MSRATAHHCPPLLRIVLLGLVALGLVLQPVLAAAGEMHELAHDPAGTHAHDLRADPPAAAPAAGDGQDAPGARTLHVLLHFAHCCGATAALLPLLEPMPLAPVNGRLALAEASMPPAVPLPSPFKPPIRV